MATSRNDEKERGSAPAAPESQRLWRLAAMGGTLATEIIAGALIGWLLDKLFGTEPVLLIVFTVAGVLIGMISFIRTALRESGQAGRNARGIGAAHPRQPDHETPEDRDE